MDLTSLKILNPWWGDLQAIDRDPHLAAVCDKPYYFDNPVKRLLPTTVNQIAILRGCRQVGKTTLLKETLREAMIARSYAAEACLYLTCEGFADFTALQHWLADWLHRRRQQPVFVCLDEITFVEQWQRALLWCINAGLTQNATLLITGSNARDLKQSAERFPGRHVTEHKIYPLDVQDYSRLVCFQRHSFAERLELYTHVGGFPHAIRDYYVQGQVSDETYETYANWIFGDAHRFRLHREVLLHVLFRLTETMASRITWQKLIQDSPIQSHETAASYIEHLEDAFLTVVLRCYDPEKHLAAPRKARKAYFIDPLLYALVGGYLRGIRNVNVWWRQQLTDRARMGALFESIVVNHFARRHANLYFWYSAQLQREVDVLVPQPGGPQLYDVKLSDTPLSRVLGREVQLVTPKTLDRFV